MDFESVFSSENVNLCTFSHLHLTRTQTHHRQLFRRIFFGIEKTTVSFKWNERILQFLVVATYLIKVIQTSICDCHQK